MSRRRAAVKRTIHPDAKYNNLVLSKFINYLLYDGKKAVAESIVYQALDNLRVKAKADPLQIFEDAIKNAKPSIEVRSRRVGGATYQIPVEVRDNRALALAIRWLIAGARARGEKSMVGKLTGEIMDAAAGRGHAIKKREDTHRMAEANKAFSHYRW